MSHRAWCITQFNGINGDYRIWDESGDGGIPNLKFGVFQIEVSKCCFINKIDSMLCSLRGRGLDVYTHKSTSNLDEKYLWINLDEFRELQAHIVTLGMQSVYSLCCFNH